MLVLIKRSLLRKILSVKTCIICRGIFRTQSSSYHGAFCTKKKLTSFSRWKKPPEAFYKKGCSKNFSKSTGKTFNTLAEVFSFDFFEILKTPFYRSRITPGHCFSAVSTSFAKKLYCRFSTGL